MDIYQQMRDTMRRVAEARRTRDGLALEEKAITAAHRATHAVLFAAAKAAKDDATLAEQTAKALADAHYAVTAETKPVEGVTVKLMTRCSYPPAEALEWAREKRLALVPESLNADAFEAIMSAMSEDERPAFVTFTKVPQVQLASDLASYLTPSETTV